MTVYFSAYTSHPRSYVPCESPRACKARLWPQGKAKAMQDYIDQNTTAPQEAQALSKDRRHDR